jgi:hypothetical protein
VRRREFIALLGSTSGWPLLGRAQQQERVRRIAVLMVQAADDPEGQARLTAFLHGGGIATGDPHGADRVRAGHGSSRCGLCRWFLTPGGNITGFMYFEHGISGKWLELLKEVAPRVTRVAVIRELNNAVAVRGLAS